jgi:hypothetical protein
MQPNSPSASFSGRLGVVFGAAVLRGALNLGSMSDDGLIASLGGCLLVLGTLAWLDSQGKGGMSPERLDQTGPTPLDQRAVPTLLTIVIGFLMFLGPFFGLVVGIFYFNAALNPKYRKDGQKIVLSELVPMLFKAGTDRERASQILASLLVKTDAQTRAAAASTPAPAPAPKPKAKATPSAAERVVPPATWGTLEPTADTRADWFNEPVAERAIAHTDPTRPLAADEVAPFHVAPASALGDWSLGTSSAITTSSVQTVSYDQPPDTTVSSTDHFGSERAPSGFDEALAMLQAKPADKRRD